MNGRSVRIAAVALAIAGLALASTGRTIGVAVAMVSVFFLASTLSKAGKYATELASFERKAVTMRLWGSAPEAHAQTYRVRTVVAIGAGLHIFVERTSGGGVARLKIAQPDGLVRSEAEVRITNAKYLQWDRRNVPAAQGAPAVVITAVGAAARS